MNWQEFLAELSNQINNHTLNLNHQPACQEANKNEVLLGLGQALEKPQIGICVNHKGTARKSLSEFIVFAEPEILTVWQQKIAEQSICDLTYVIEDFSPDTCLGLIFFWARVKNITALPEDWINYVTRWELGDTKTTGHFSKSWGILHSALSHYYLQSDKPVAGFHACLNLLLTALLEKANPAQVPELPNPAYQQALFHLHYEQQEYEKSLQNGQSIQLAIPIDHCPQRRLLIDVFIIQEEVALGCAKYFLRNDVEHT